MPLRTYGPLCQYISVMMKPGGNMILLRLVAGAGLLALGYYVGREVGRLQPIREELKQTRDASYDEPESDREQDNAEG